MTKWYEEKEGVTSGMRVIVMMVSVTGCAAVIAGAVGMFLDLTAAAAIAGVGGGMAGISNLAKAWQAQVEK